MTVKELRYLVDNLDEYIHIPGGIERLKKTILHLAVSGQLVPQDPSEGTGEELYQKIQGEKAKLIAEGKIKKQKPLPRITEDEISFEIPKSWKWVRLADAVVFSIGRTPARKDSTYWDEEYMPWVSIADLRAGEHILSTKEMISKKAFLKCFGTSVPAGSLLYSFKLTIGKMSIIDMDAVHNEAIASFITYAPEFTKYLFKALEVIDPTDKTNQAIMGKTLNSASLSLVEIPLPSLAEQKRIVEKVDTIFQLIDDLSEKYAAEQAEREKLIASSLTQLSQGNGDLALTHLAEIIRTKSDATKLRQTILHLAVSGQLVPQDSSEGTGEELYQKIQAERAKLIGEGKIKKQKPLPEIIDQEIPFEIPESWRWVRLGDVSDVFNGNSINASEKKIKYKKVTDGHPYLGTKDIGYGFDSIDYDNGVKIPYEESKFVVIKTGTVLICSEGGSAGKKCGIIDRDVAFGNKMYAFNSYGHFIRPQYVLYNYLTKSFYEQFQSKMTGIIGGISVANFKELIIPLPSKAEQTRIVQKTTQLLDLITKLEYHLEK